MLQPNSESSGASGKWVVLAMFAFAILVTGALWVYSRLHNAPFLPLRRALAEEFGREAAPRVEGGRHRGGPQTLRITINVDFNPTTEEAEVRKRTREIERTAIALARQHLDLTSYETLEIHLIQPLPEAAPRRRLIKHRVSELPPP